MVTLKSVGVLLSIYVLFVLAFEGIYLGMMQPSFEEAGIPMLTITTEDEYGNQEDRMLARIRLDDKIYVSAHHWPRGWYRRAIDNPNVKVAIDGVAANYLAVEVAGEEFNQVARKAPLPLFVRFLMGFPPPRDIARLDPATEKESG